MCGASLRDGRRLLLTRYFAPKCRHWNPYTGPRSISWRSYKPRESRNSREPLASHMCTFLSASVLASVLPDMNQSSSSTTPRQNTLLVVRSGKLFERSYLIWAPNFERVPTPVRSSRQSPDSRISAIRSRYCRAQCKAVLERHVTTSPMLGAGRGYLIFLVRFQDALRQRSY